MSSLKASWWPIAFAAAAAIALLTVHRIQPTTTDIHLDRAHAIEAWSGDPYVTQHDLVVNHGLGHYGHPAPSPRTPGAIAFESLTIPLSDATLLWLSVMASLVCTAVVFYASARIGGIDQRWAVATFVLYLAIRPGRLMWWNVTDLAIPLVVLAWLYLGNHRIAGPMLGVAAAIKAWPLVIVGVLFLRKDTRPVSVWAAATALLTTAIGLAIPRVSVSGTVESLSAAAALWGSPPGWLALTCGALLLVAAVMLADRNLRYGAAVVAGLVLSPIMWIDYWLAALPLLAITLGRVRSNSEPQPTETPSSRTSA